MASLIACHECDLINREAVIPLGAKAYCRRCGARLYQRTPDSLDRTLACMLAAAVLMVVANVYPIVGLEAQGDHTSTTLFGAVRTLYDDGMTSVAALIFVTAILMPALEVGAMLCVLVPLKLGKVSKLLPVMFRLVRTARPWSMVEVFMLGTLVSLAKLAHLARVVPGLALWSFAAVMVLIAAAAASFDARQLWIEVDAVGRGPIRSAESATHPEVET